MLSEHAIQVEVSSREVDYCTVLIVLPLCLKLVIYCFMTNRSSRDCRVWGTSRDCSFLVCEVLSLVL